MNILIINTSPFISGAEYSLFEYLENIIHTNSLIITVPKNENYSDKIPGDVQQIVIPGCWFTKTLNPLRHIKYAYCIIITTIKLYKTIKTKDVKIVYSNTTKSHIYGIIIKLLSPKCKTIWHIRDNINKSMLTNFLIKKTDKIICISNFIFNQVYCIPNKKVLLYGGINVLDWQSDKSSKDLKKELNIPEDYKIVAMIGQITGWKNQFDFIKVSEIVSKVHPDAHFVIIGDAMHKNDFNYKKIVLKRVHNSIIHDKISVLGYRKDLKEILSQTYLLVHTAINEPFGRVLVEAMAMEKPVVAYNCGGPSEIIINNETGFLVEVKNVKQMAEKTLQLLKNKELQAKFGKNARQRVIRHFNINEHVTKMKQIFESVLTG